MSSFFSELRRRNVIRVAIAYTVTAWLLAQVADLVLDNFAAPEWAMRTILIVLAVGFPITVIVAWVFEFTPEGVKRDADVPSDRAARAQGAQRLDRVIIAVLVLALGISLYANFSGEEISGTKDYRDHRIGPTIAVLPFENRSASEEDAFFVDGIHDDILTQLARIGSIKVISRTSVERFADSTLSIPEIGVELGATSILEGGVQRAGDRVRINVQLIDAETDEHVWADTYDRQLTARNVFSIQSEIAAAVAAEMRTALSDDEQRRIIAVPTENLEAYESYLLGRQRLAKRNLAAIREAEEYFLRATDLDPQFALAYVGLADSYHLQESYDSESASGILNKARDAIMKAIQLDDSLGEAFASRGAIKHVAEDYTGAAEDLRRALDLNPNYAPAYQWYSEILRNHLGRPESAFVQLQKAVELDPMSAAIRQDLAMHYMWSRESDKALDVYRKVLEIDPEFPRANAFMGVIYGYGLGRFDESLIWIANAASLDPDNANYAAYVAAFYLEFEDFERAAKWIERALQLSPDGYEPLDVAGYLSIYQGQESESLESARKRLSVIPRYTYPTPLAVLRDHDISLGNYDAAFLRYEAIYPELLGDDIQVGDRNYRAAIDLAYLYQANGDTQKADFLLDESMNVISSLPRIGITGYQFEDVRIYALQGNKAAALEALRQAIDDKVRGLWLYHRDHDAALESLRDEPEFQSLMAEIAADMATQLAHVRELEASGEIPLPHQ